MRLNAFTREDLNLTTLEKVSDRVNEMSKNCYDKNVTVADISFDNLETVRIGETETHQLREIAQRSISYRLGIFVSFKVFWIYITIIDW